MAKRKKAPEKQRKVQDPLGDGLARFYSSQAELLLAQYENINQLLGPTRDWSHPGIHCEVLLREFLRNHLVQGMSADKGYIYGRVKHNNHETHSPEIDILIHNMKEYTPVFRLDDLVIVMPEAVIGIIQVKRTFSSVGKENPLKKGLRQAVDAKQHLLDLLVQQKTSNDISEKELTRYIFAGVVAFEESGDVSLEKHIRGMHRLHQEQRHFAQSPLMELVSTYVLPTFVGSLKGKCAVSVGRSYPRGYVEYASDQDNCYIGLQLLLFNIMSHLSWNSIPTTKPFSLPNIGKTNSFYIPKAPKPGCSTQILEGG